MRWLAAACLLMTFCSRPPVVPATDTREPIDVAYVTGPELRVHAQPNDASPVIVKYENGEGVSIMSTSAPAHRRKSSRTILRRDSAVFHLPFRVRPRTATSISKRT